MDIFEIIMLLCFGSAWPFSIYKSYTSRSTKGKSLAFLLIVLVGYLSGVLHKILYAYDEVIIFYLINLIMVATDALLYLRNRSKYPSNNVEKRWEPEGKGVNLKK